MRLDRPAAFFDYDLVRYLSLLGGRRINETLPLPITLRIDAERRKNDQDVRDGERPPDSRLVMIGVLRQHEREWELKHPLRDERQDHRRDHVARRAEDTSQRGQRGGGNGG